MITSTAWRPLSRALMRAEAYRHGLCSIILRSRLDEGAFCRHACGCRTCAGRAAGILSEARLSETSVAWLTSGAVATGPEEGVSALSRAPLWGLVRSARAEHPDRQLQLVDVDASRRGGFADEAVVDGAEPELALRHGSVLAPRLVRARIGSGRAAPS